MPLDHPVFVYKFGGTSVKTPERIRSVVDLVLREQEHGLRVVVVSALGGVTDELVRAVDEALARSGRHADILDALKERHLEAVDQLSSGEEKERLQAKIESKLTELAELLDGVYLLRECTLRTMDAIMGMGEQLSAPLVAAAFRSVGVRSEALDARDFIRTDASFGEANVLFDETRDLVRERFESIDADTVAVVTGYIASTERGVSTTLGRSGSDYTATVLGGALQAEHVVIWTDVDGVLSADPRLVPDTFALPQLSYREAAELAYFGAKVLHPRTMRPLQRQKIPLRIKNTLNPDAAGTLISEKTTTMEGHVKAITAIRDVAVVMLEGTGLIGIPGISARALNALAVRSINVLMIAQASSEQSLCLVVRSGDAEVSAALLRQAFELELSRGDVASVYVIPHCAVISSVGDNMRDRPGLAGRMFATLGRSGVNVLAIAQGASETNISAVVSDAEVKQAVHALHDEFALVRHRVHVFMLGVGVVGQALLEMLADQQEKLLDELNLNIHLVGLANTTKMAWDVEGIPFGDAMDVLEASDSPGGLKAIVDQLKEAKLNRMMVIDASASDEVAQQYPELLERSIAVITPNKRANTKDQAFYERLQRAAHRQQVPYMYETTVGAGLPIISTLRDLIRTGDEVIRIEGVLSGTLAYIFSSMTNGMKFSEAVRTARSSGFTEPDPRDDLQGEDVARKLLILAREMGLSVEREDLDVESLVPAHLVNVSVDVFMERLEELDAEWDERVTQATDRGGRLQYMGLIEKDRLTVRTRWVSPDSPFAQLKGTDNMVVYTTRRYNDYPLVVQGPGAGPVVTAAGILADLIKAAELGG
ncbi:MAG: bifunctional aspartate kinase/homoserine dehydrogenase I [Rhodothermales bacterium]